MTYRAWEGPPDGTKDIPKRAFFPPEEAAEARHGSSLVLHSGMKKLFCTLANLIACHTECISNGSGSKRSVVEMECRPKVLGADRKKIADIHALRKIFCEPCHPFGPGTALFLADGTSVFGVQILKKIGDRISNA
jgi:hypothetical protein